MLSHQGSSLIHVTGSLATKNMNKENVKQNVEKAKQSAEREIKKIKKTFDDASKKTQEYIEKNPKKAATISVGVGAAIGAALAFLFGKRKK